MSSAGKRIPLALRLHGVAIYVFLYLPIALMIFFSFNKSPLGTFPVTGYTLHWYKDLADEDFLVAAFWNSLFVAGIATPTATLIGCSVRRAQRRTPAIAAALPQESA